MEATTYLEKIERRRTKQVVRELDASLNDDQHQGEPSGRRCLVCGDSITPKFWLCNDCQKECGRSSKDWPEWLRFLYANGMAEKRRVAEEDDCYLFVEFTELDEENAPSLEESSDVWYNPDTMELETVPFEFGEGTYHGSTGYRHGCRCDTCKTANRECVRKWRNRSKSLAA